MPWLLLPSTISNKPQEEMEEKLLQACEIVVCLDCTSEFSCKLHYLRSQCLGSAFFLDKLILEKEQGKKHPKETCGSVFPQPDLTGWWACVLCFDLNRSLLLLNKLNRSRNNIRASEIFFKKKDERMKKIAEHASPTKTIWLFGSRTWSLNKSPSQRFIFSKSWTHR